jgi:hypothetical protein
MAAGVHNITIEQGATFTLSLDYRNSDGDVIPLTGWTGRMQVRKDYNSPSPLLDLPGTDGTITITGGTGHIDIKIPADITAGLSLYGKDSATWVYDLEVAETATGTVKRLLRGTATVTAEVTR